MKPENEWQAGMNRWDLATKKWEPKHHDVLCSKHFEKKMGKEKKGVVDASQIAHY